MCIPLQVYVPGDPTAIAPGPELEIFCRKREVSLRGVKGVSLRGVKKESMECGSVNGV